MKTWNNCKNILCIRPDNMGDVIMSGPAIRALKESFNARITVLTSSVAAGITRFMPEIDEVIIFDLPWVKTQQAAENAAIISLIEILKSKQFDAAVIFTVFSQNPLPTALLAYQANIPRVLAYCRENPYRLLTNWVPDQEPYTLIRHQVERDLALIATVGAKPYNNRLHLEIPAKNGETIGNKLKEIGIEIKCPWLLLHAGVSEAKRQYPVELWVETGKLLVEQGFQILLTGTSAEAGLIQQLQQGIGSGAIDGAGKFNLEELIYLIKKCPLLLSVNTGVTHIAAAVGTPVVVLYAQTNPQHTPWQVLSKVLEFAVNENRKSRNEVIAHLQKTIYRAPAVMPSPTEVVKAVNDLLRQSAAPSQPFPGKLNENQAIAAS